MSLRFLPALVISAASVLSAGAFAQDTGFAVRKIDIKAEPYTDAATVGSLAEKTQVRIVGRQGGWMKVESQGAGGWVRMLAIRSATTAESKSGDSGIGALFNVARTGSSGTAVATGVRGLDKEQIRNAKPNPAELEKLSGFRAGRADAERFAEGKPALKAQSIDYLSGFGQMTTGRSTLVRLAAALALAGVSPGAGAQFSIDLGRILDTAKNIGRAATDVSEEQEAAIGKEYASLLVGAAPLLDQPDAQRYVNRVGRWLSLHSERPNLDWKFGILASDNINAFATPGGYVLVTRGLLVRLRSEAELAGVLAHEIAHVVKKHHLAAIRKGAGLQAGANILAEYSSNRARNPAATERMISGAKEVMLRGLDKDDEFEADRMGVVIAARAGYDPFGLPAVLQTLQGMNPEDSGLALMFSTHPAPGARLDQLERVMTTRLDGFAGQPQVAERFARTLGAK